METACACSPQGASEKQGADRSHSQLPADPAAHRPSSAGSRRTNQFGCSAKGSRNQVDTEGGQAVPPSVGGSVWAVMSREKQPPDVKRASPARSYGSSSLRDGCGSPLRNMTLPSSSRCRWGQSTAHNGHTWYTRCEVHTPCLKFKDTQKRRRRSHERNLTQSCGAPSNFTLSQGPPPFLLKTQCRTRAVRATTTPSLPRFRKARESERKLSWFCKGNHMPT